MLDPSTPRDALIAAGRERLLTHAIDGLRALLSPSALARDVPVSRDTAYRVMWGDEAESVTDAVIAAVALAANDPAWGGSDDVLREAAVVFASEVENGSDGVTTFIATLAAVVEAQFRSAGHPVGWVLQSAALSGSEAWQGVPPNPDSQAVAREVLAARRLFYEETSERLEPFVMLAMSELGRRPRRGQDPRSMLVMIHTLLDGAVLRRFIEPDAITPRQVAEAMYVLCLGLSEEGSAIDPRQPDDEYGLGLFDRLVEAAAGLWRTPPGPTVEEAAERAGVQVEAARLLFPTVGDLADSLVRSRVAAGGFADGATTPAPTDLQPYVSGMVSKLRRLAELADELPLLLAATAEHHPTRSRPFVEDFVAGESEVVAASGRAAHPEQLARDLVGFAAQGGTAWPSVVALLRTIDQSR